MRKVKTTATSVLAIGLLVGAGAAAVAQDDAAATETPTGASYFTGTYEERPPVVQPEMSSVDGVEQMRGFVLQDSMETSDPRMSGDVTRAANVNISVLDPAGDVAIGTEVWLIENEGGSWTGPGTNFGYVDEESELILDSSSVLLTGAGGYQGLSAYLLLELMEGTEAPTPAVTGAIFVGDAPPLPDPPTPAAE